MEIDNSVALSTRIRLARNIKGFLFPSIIRNGADEKKLIDLVVNVLRYFGGYTLYEMKGLNSLERQSFVERYIVSNYLASNQFGAVAENVDGCTSLMLNEEDHIREQCILSGFNLKLAKEKIFAIDTALNNNFRFAKDEKLGYITACPSNLGSGMRASVMLFLPALTYSGEIEKIISDAYIRGITIRGALGEGSENLGDLYQVSNSSTMKSERQIIFEVENFVLELINKELSERNILYSQHRYEFEDKIFRALGILENAKLLTYNEFADFWSKIRLGSKMNILSFANAQQLDDLLITVRPATLKIVTNSNSDERLLRAEYVKKALQFIKG